MADRFEIYNTTVEDLDVIHQLFEHSIRYQIARGFPDWRNYDRNAIVDDINNLHQYKIIFENEIAIVFSVCYTDPVIWRERETGDAIYLHRIVVNPTFKGQKLFGKILDWIKQHCQERGLQKIRMDTWAKNPNIIQYYCTFGFQIIETFTTPDSEALPIHNRNLALTLLEYHL